MTPRSTSITSITGPSTTVVALLTEHAEIPVISSELKSAGVDVAAVEILCGERGAAILDEHGRYHGLRARVVRAFSGSVTTRRPWRPTTRRCGTVTCCCVFRRARRTAAASRRCSSATRSTTWATSGRAPSSSSPSPIRADPGPGTAGRLGGWCVQDLAPCPPHARKEGHTRRFTVIHGATALLLTCATTGTRPTSPLSGPGGGRRCQQVLWSLAGRAPTAWGASWTARRAGQRGARWFSTT
jgi:hypothetical protein